MNPFTESNLKSLLCDVTASHSDHAPCRDSHSPSVSSPPAPQVVPTNHSSPPCEASSDQHGGQDVVRSPDSGLEVTPETPPPFSAPSPNPYHTPVPGLHSCQSPEDSPDLECAICLCDFNNVFRCPKMLHCRHTFCLECLARININSSEPGTIQCPLCRRLTPLPDLGLPRLPTDSVVLSYLPSAMQRVYSIRFLRNKGKLKVKRSSERHQRWGQRSSRDANHSLNVGRPSPSLQGQSGGGAVGGGWFRLRGQPACHVFLLMCVLMMTALLTGIFIFLLILWRSNV
ncbi:unnamed protein product [Pleuronectes platessa]|uniref:RING-type domain-containing protein n=1 Tax=Pleuronectes platessa TaxID=8262 RepID=A0A9N7TW73_PLEPL|nr:unnamed protein product [Pleuronectes platessa]